VVTPVFEIRVTRKISGPNRDEVTEDWRRLHNEELYYMHFSPNIIRVIIPRRMRCVREYGTFGGEKLVSYFLSLFAEHRASFQKFLGLDVCICRE
jgi:hypothetical protein